MAIFKEIPPTAGLPIRISEIVRALINTQPGLLENYFKDYLKVPYASITYSGTAAFYLICESLKELSSKKTIIIPSFICPLIPLAINRAGLKVEVCDINEEDFNYNQKSLQDLCSQNNDILAILVVHLAGIPLKLDSFKDIADKAGAFVIEDCAQSLGAEYKGRKVGTFGDFSFFSLCRGKGATIYEGGVLVSKDNKYSALLDRKVNQFTKNNFLSEALKIIEIIGYSIFYRPFLFWFIFKAPQYVWNFLGKKDRANIEYFDIDFPLHRVSNFRKSLGITQLKKINSEIISQRKKAQDYISLLDESEKIKIIKEAPLTKSNYPYLTILFKSKEDRILVYERLVNFGLGVSQIYACPISEYSYLSGIIPNKEFPSAKSISFRHLTLTTSLFINELEIKKISSCIKNL